MPDKLSLQNKMLALKKVSETLLQQLQQEIEAIDAKTVEKQLQQREQIISALAQHPAKERQAFQTQYPEIVSSTRGLGEQCLIALEKQGFALHETQRQMSHGRHLLQTYQPEAEQQSHFIEDDA